jgi:hypothetical protein
MRTISIAVLVLLVGCSEVSGPVSVTPDAGPVQIVGDAGPEILADSGPVSLTDSGNVDRDAERIPDAGSFPVDAGAPTSLEDASAPAEDAGPTPPAPDAGTGSDAGAPGSPDAGPVGCVPDGFEANETAADAVLFEEVPTGAAVRTVPLTWHAGDAADWLELDLVSPGIPLRITATDSDHLSEVEIRATCSTGVVLCRGFHAVSHGDTCSTSRREIAYLDVACADLGARVEVRAGSVRAATSTRCEHSLRVAAERAP